MPVMETHQATLTFSVRPFARIVGDVDSGDLLDAILSTLELDEHVIAPVCGYDPEQQLLEATFQVEAPVTGRTISDATAKALESFHFALSVAGVYTAAAGLSIVQGDDPDLLP